MKFWRGTRCKFLLFATIAIVFAVKSRLLFFHFAFQHEVPTMEVSGNPILSHPKQKTCKHYEAGGLESTSIVINTSNFFNRDAKNLRWDNFSDRFSGASWWELFYVIDRFKIVYCSIPKSGSTNIRNYFLHLASNSNSTYRYSNAALSDLKAIHFWNFKSPHQRRLSSYPLPIAQNIMRRYKKVTFIRDPLDRLISAWFNKLGTVESDSMFTAKYQEIGRSIIKQFRKNATLEEIERGLPVSFEEFLLYLNEQQDSAKLEQHWRPMVDICLFDSIRYDFIGQTENLSCDMNYFITEVLRLPEPAHKLPLPENRFVVENKEKLLKNVSRDLLAKVVKKHYASDYKLFDYEFRF